MEENPYKSPMEASELLPGESFGESRSLLEALAILVGVLLLAVVGYFFALANGLP